MWKTKIRRLLEDKLKEATGTTTDTLSNREFGLRIGLSSGALSEILSGKRKLTLKYARRILDALVVDENERKELLQLINDDLSNSRTILNDESYDLISNWIYFAVLSVLEVDHPPAKPQDIADQLGIAIEETTSALELLASYGYIEKLENGDYKTLGKRFGTTDDVPSSTVAERHFNNMRLGMAALSRIPVKERDFTSITFTANSNQLDRAKKEIRKFLESLSDEMSDGKLDQVYQLNIQLYPIAGWEKPADVEHDQKIP